MSINFKSTSQTLAETIKSASNTNATFVIPDLQRPFVWSPLQIILLVDSIFKGWPFGTLLLWEVKPDCFNENEGIPHRPFWQVVDRTKEDEGTQATTFGMPATYHMVLDGQQRIQSLVLALGGDKWGFKLYDSEWAISMLDKRIKSNEHWSSAVLCLDLEKFKVELKSKNNKVRKIEVGKILDWAVTDVYKGISNGKQKTADSYPFIVSEHSGRFIRLSRFWDLTQKSLTETEYQEILKPLLNEHSVAEDQINELINPLSQFMQVVENIKINSSVYSLQIDSFTLTPQWNKDDYSDAIVNIFTRLNTAGRTLTREEITLAWLKVGWDKSNTNDKPASVCLNELIETFVDNGINVEIDEIVRLISFIWSVDERNGDLLDSKDLLKGDIIRPMAKTVSSNWTNITETIKNGLEIIKERNLVRVRGSFNAIIVYLTWYRLVTNQLKNIKQTLSATEKDSFDKQTNDVSQYFLDRWIFCSQWANVWGEGSVVAFGNFAKDISESKQTIAVSNKFDYIAKVNDSISKLMDRIIYKANDFINNTNVRDRNRVRQYYTLLWVWHRLDGIRWKYSSIQLKEGRKRNAPLDVDHTVADALWKRKVKENYDNKLLAFSGTDEEKALIAPDEFLSIQEANEFINFLGNCSLLEKSFNISKSDKEMKSFLIDVHEYKNGNFSISDWEVALSIENKMTEPSNATLKDLVEPIKKRDALIRKDLIEFANGAKYRID
jgi:hypothetical protein